ncbi:ATP synthase F1 subunit gamma [candidate division KSB1 bacterium]|nr:ATP synthase F1 subunit gamma [candidate division KSB1 bacterium]
MATLRNIKRRISSVRSTQQITRAMKMVAAAKLRKVQNKLTSSRPYIDALREMMGNVVARSKKDLHPMLEERPARHICFVLVTADRGLCGGFNNNLIKRAVRELEGTKARKVDLFAIGRKGYEYFKRRDYAIPHHRIDFFNHLEFSHADEISHTLIDLYLKRTYDRIYVIYSEFISAIQQEVVVRPLLPIQPQAAQNQSRVTFFKFEPSPRRILKDLCPKSVQMQMWQILLESNTSELGARMAAMEAATDNAEEMIKELTLFYNKTRQAAITKEINEIVGGAEALRG